MFSLGVGSELLEGHVPSAESGDEPSSSSRWLNSEIERKEDQTLMQACDAFGNYGTQQKCFCHIPEPLSRLTATIFLE